MQSTFASGLSTPQGLAFDGAGNLFVADADTGVIYKFTPNGAQSIFVSGLQTPDGIVFDAAGDLFVSTISNDSVVKISPSGAKTIFAGALNVPTALAFDSAGNLFEADSSSNSIFEFAPDGTRTTFATGLNAPDGVAFDSTGNLFVVNHGNNGSESNSILKFASDGRRTTFAAGLNEPAEIAFDSGGNLFVTNFANNEILKFTPGGTPTTFASGLGQPRYLTFAPIIGRWSVVPSPNSSPNQLNDLYAVTCVSASDCWAVGWHQNDQGVARTLIEHDTGSGWTVVSSPNASANTDQFLYAVSCVAADNCWAAGYWGRLSGFIITYETLLLHYDGTAWSIVSSPNAELSSDNVLYGLTCTGASDCWAVGYYLVSATAGSEEPLYLALIEHYDGTSWSVVEAAPPFPDNVVGGIVNVLQSVSCISASDCTAVGNYLSPTDFFQTLVEHYDGTLWTVATSPNPDTTKDNFLYSVTCAAGSGCRAVGDIGSTLAGGFQTLIEENTGSGWIVVASPAIDSGQNGLFAVTCPGANDCWATGTYNNGTTYQTLIEHYDGASWALISSPNASSDQANVLSSVTCSSAINCRASGYYSTGGSAARTLVEEFTVPVQLVSVASRMSHGSAGSFDIDLTSGNGVECRSGGANGDYTLVFTFANALTTVDGASVTSGTGTIGSSNIDGSDAQNYIVNLTGIANAQLVSVSLTNVSDSVGDFNNSVSASMGVLLGDVNGSHRVDAADVSSVRQQTLQAITSDNFRNDINASGRIDAADVSIARQQTLTSLP
jgi:hypothetical protein